MRIEFCYRWVLNVSLTTMLLGVGGAVSADTSESSKESSKRNIYIQTGAGTYSAKVNVKPEIVLRQENITRQKYDYSCGSAALTTLLNAQLDLNLKELDVIDGLLKHGELEKIKAGRRFSLLDMKRYLAQTGINSAGYSAAIEDLPEIQAPAIVSIVIQGFKHFVVYRGVVDGHVIIADPAFGNISVSVTKFDEMWTPKIFFTVDGAASLGKQRKPLGDESLRYVKDAEFYQTVLRLNTYQSNPYAQSRSLERAGVLQPRFIYR